MVGRAARIAVVLLGVAALRLLAAEPPDPTAPPRLAAASLHTELDVEQRLLEQDLTAYRQARATERQLLSQAASLASSFDEALTAAEPSLTEIERLRRSLSGSEAAVEAASRRVEELRDTTYERLQRIALLRSDLARLERGSVALPDPVSGRWKVSIEPGEIAGTFDLELDGTLVSGLYQLADGRSGSLRGTFTGGGVRLEQVDRDRGLTAVFRGAVDGAAGRMVGFWTPTDVSGGAPGGGDWTARKIESEEETTP